MDAIRILYFAWVRERIGVEEETVAVEDVLPLGALLDRLAARSAAHAAVLGERARLRAAINQDFASWETFVHPGDEVAIFPPVTGG
jgi:molybdopterin synthase sulfur carrier subunit